MNVLFAFFRRVDWKRTYALIVIYGYAYNIIFWPFALWGAGILTALYDTSIPGPPLVPWEHLLVATTNLAVIGGVQLLRERNDRRRGKRTDIMSDGKSNATQ